MICENLAKILPAPPPRFPPRLHGFSILSLSSRKTERQTTFSVVFVLTPAPAVLSQRTPSTTFKRAIGSTNGRTEEPLSRWRLTWRPPTHSTMATAISCCNAISTPQPGIA